MRVRLTVALAATAAILVFNACDDGTEKRALVPEVLLTAPAGSVPTPAVIIGDGAANVEPRDFIDRINAGAAATYTVRYTTEASGELGGEFVVYSLPPLARVDAFEQGQDAPASIAVSRDGDLAIGCVPGGAGWECDPFALEGPLILTASPIVYPTAGELAEATIAADSQREIAGVIANCWVTTRPVAEETRVTHYCLSAGGVVLFAQTNSGIIRAVEFSETASNEDFVLPISQ